ncbi:MAG: hypothetical protein R3C49_26800 [Planctomycetaceae bacterium]
MPKYQTGAIDETTFLEFVNSPSSKLLAEFVKSLSSDEQANSFFEEEPPVWVDDATSWVKDHLSNDDWYRDLTEPEAVAWDSAIDKVTTRFKCPKRIKGTNTEKFISISLSSLTRCSVATKATIKCCV